MPRDINIFWGGHQPKIAPLQSLNPATPGRHRAIVAREYGVPAVVNVPEVLKIVRDGMPVTVDGDEGKILLH